jgi:hypothetical protein
MSKRSRARQQRRIELPSAGQTIVSLVLRPVDEGSPWPLTRVLTALGSLDIERTGTARALGDRQRVPLVHSQDLTWRGTALFIEARHGRGGIDELSLEMPPWDDVVTGLGEDDAWSFVDTVASAADAQFGSIGDGEPPEVVLPDDAPMLRAQLRRHLALLLPGWAVDDIADAEVIPARVLEASGLLVLTS